MSFLRMTGDNFSNKSISSQYLSFFLSSQEIAAKSKSREARTGLTSYAEKQILQL